MSNGGKTITLKDIEPEVLTLTRTEESIRIECRFVYLGDDGKQVMIGDTAARDYIRVTLPADSPHLTRIRQFMAQTVMPFIREQKGLT